MTGVLEGFAALAALIALGAVLAHVGFLTYASQTMLVRLAFWVASPALLLTVVADADVHAVFSANLVATTGAVAGALALYLLLSRVVARRPAPETVVAGLCSMYVNAGNLGLPVAAYVLGDAALVAPVILLQLVLLQPLALAVLDRTTAGRGMGVGRLALRTVRNPLMLGAVLGLVLALTGLQLPSVVRAPVDLLGGMAVPAMLLAYGVSLRLGPKPGAGSPARELVLVVGLKLLVQPALAYLVGVALGLQDTALYAVAVLAALPTAQNVFVVASRYDRGVVLARDAIFLSTIGSVPVILAITALLA
ncbi:MAG TPA: AEC family transporter [Phototrophicaceae bacterium]|uniref:AEC family transporter n=1 Tax=Oceanitalea stevensii TaxID=2763072 RepID=A0ABR8Z0H2_9MICO|nr:AEC family transporter [Oceanitalea stevensii]MBD8061749.1 AEC family transporter [Oceanitalea stevensii]HLT83434.1 AEC family transporter [Phototrophicaceae bacterium]